MPKELYLAKNLEELNKKTAVPPKVFNQAPKIQLNSVTKLLEEAKLKEGRDKDEEQAYVFYMKSLEILQRALKNPQLPPSDQDYYKKLHNLENIFEKCQKLADVLRKRYRLYELSSLRETLESDEIMKEKADATKLRGYFERKNEVRLKSGMSGVPTKSRSWKDIQNQNIVGDMTAKELKTLIEQKSTLLIIDCRLASDFMNAHLDHPNCISLPSEMLIQGQSANKIGELLRIQYPRSYVDWSRRDRFEKIILYDWNSSFEHPGPYVQAVYDAITKRDYQTNYKSKPYVIQGGFRNIYYSYPTLVNKSQNVKESSPNCSPRITITKLTDGFDLPRSYLLKLSHSNPNKSQIGDSYDDDSLSSVKPTFNRSLKPTNRALKETSLSTATIYSINNNTIPDVTSRTCSPTFNPVKLLMLQNNISYFPPGQGDFASKPINSEAEAPRVNDFSDRQAEDKVNKLPNVCQAPQNVGRLVSAKAALATNSISNPSFDEDDSKIKSANLGAGSVRSVARPRRTSHLSTKILYSSKLETDVKENPIPVSTPVGQANNKEYDPKLKRIVEDISRLTLLEVSDLNELLKKTLNVCLGHGCNGPCYEHRSGFQPAGARAQEEEVIVYSQESSDQLYLETDEVQ